MPLPRPRWRFRLRTLMVAVAVVAVGLWYARARVRWEGYRRQALWEAAAERRYASAARGLRMLTSPTLSTYYELPDGAIFAGGWTTVADGTLVAPEDLAKEYDRKARYHAERKSGLLNRW